MLSSCIHPTPNPKLLSAKVFVVFFFIYRTFFTTLTYFTNSATSTFTDAAIFYHYEFLDLRFWEIISFSYFIDIFRYLVYDHLSYISIVEKLQIFRIGNSNRSHINQEWTHNTHDSLITLFFPHFETAKWFLYLKL